MNKYQEIIEYFGVRIINVLPLRNRKELSKANAILILELVDKATPKKPYYPDLYPSASCPMCKSNLGDNKYCRECGQAIDWSTDEK